MLGGARGVRDRFAPARSFKASVQRRYGARSFKSLGTTWKLRVSLRTSEQELPRFRCVFSSTIVPGRVQMKQSVVVGVCLALGLGLAGAALAKDQPELQAVPQPGAAANAGEHSGRVQQGRASYYGREFNGRRMANGLPLPAGLAGGGEQDPASRHDGARHQPAEWPLDDGACGRPRTAGA